MYMGQRLLWVFSDSSLIFQLLIHVGHRYVKKVTLMCYIYVLMKSSKLVDLLHVCCIHVPVCKYYVHIWAAMKDNYVTYM